VLVRGAAGIPRAQVLHLVGKELRLVCGVQSSGRSRHGERGSSTLRGTRKVGRRCVLVEDGRGRESRTPGDDQIAIIVRLGFIGLLPGLPTPPAPTRWKSV
jgi:hypothetical protein